MWGGVVGAQEPPLSVERKIGGNQGKPANHWLDEWVYGSGLSAECDVMVGNHWC